MIDIENIQSFSEERPSAHTVFGTAAEFDQLPETHRAQIFFLNKEASDYISDFSSDAGLMTGGCWAPFEKGNFKHVEEYYDFSRDVESRQKLKKWLYGRGLSFSNWVFIVENSNSQVILTTWKIVVKYSSDLFIMNDRLLFDRTLNWCLFFFHEDVLFFGKDNIYDNSDDLQKMERLNDRKKKFPQFKHPYL